jgi:hypothetical protein
MKRLNGRRRPSIVVPANGIKRIDTNEVSRSHGITPGPLGITPDEPAGDC